METNNNNNVFSGFNYHSALACETESTRHPYASYSYAPTSAPVTVNDSFLFTPQHGIASHALISNSNGRCCYSLYGGDVSPLHPDPHLVCLKLGKRHYFEDSTLLGSGGGGGGFYSIGKKDKPASSTAVVVPRCQVEGCNVALVNAKDYHRRHKVCEMHSKAPKVMVLGLEQRFCQQCSRFHVVSEFDDTKRSCRRRLAGHNERRRKTTSHDSFSRSTSLDNMTSGYQYLPLLGGCALSLLSPRPDSSIVSSSDLSSRSRAALHELIAEKRASNLSPQLIDLDRNWQLNSNTNTNGVAQTSGNYNYATNNQQHHMFPASSSWDQRLRFHDGTGSHVTLDLMQAASSSPFGWLSMKGKTKEECSQMWNSMDGSHVI